MPDKRIMPSEAETSSINGAPSHDDIEKIDKSLESPQAVGDIDVAQARDKKFSTIKWLHFGAAVFFFIQTVAYCAAEANLSITPTVNFATYCNEFIETCTGTFSTKPSQKLLAATNPIWLIPFFTALACFDHIVSFVFCLRYADFAKMWVFDIQSNPFRWIEYSISASVMAWAISILCGISDVHLWFLIFFCHFVGILIGLFIELLPDDKASGVEIQQEKGMSFQTMKKLLFALSCVSIFFPWLVMICYFFGSTANSSNGDGDALPNFVYAAFFGTLALFTTFGINTYLNKIEKKYDFATAEIIFISLSFTAKTFLAADVFGGLANSD